MKSFFKNIYIAIPFKKQIFSFLKYFWKPSVHTYKHLHFKGVIDVRISPQRKFKMVHYGFQVENDIFWSGLEGEWEKESIQVWIKLCKKSRTIIDVGANTGVYALVAKTINPSAEVYAFEPVKRVYDKLVYNNNLNKYDIVCCESALSNTDGTAVIYDTPAEHTYSVTVNKNLNTTGLEAFETQIKTVKLSTFITEEKIEKIDLMKIDVESHEPEVLEGMGNYIEQMKPTLLIEILNNEIGKKVEFFLKNKGYLYFRIGNTGIIKTTDISIKDNYCNYLVCNEIVAKELDLI